MAHHRYRDLLHRRPRYANAGTDQVTTSDTDGAGGSASQARAETIHPQTAATTLQVSSPAPVVGQPVTYTATLGQRPETDRRGRLLPLAGRHGVHLVPPTTTPLHGHLHHQLPGHRIEHRDRRLGRHQHLCVGIRSGDGTAAPRPPPPPRPPPCPGRSSASPPPTAPPWLSPHRVTPPRPARSASPTAPPCSAPTSPSPPPPLHRHLHRQLSRHRLNTVTASYLGDTNTSVSASDPATVTVAPAATTTTIQGSTSEASRPRPSPTPPPWPSPHQATPPRPGRSTSPTGPP